MNPKLERWLAKVKSHLPGPVYDHPQKPPEPWNEGEVWTMLFAWRDAAGSRVDQRLTPGVD